MAKDDIYGNKKKYEALKNDLKSLTKKPEGKTINTRKYYCKNPENLEYVKKLFLHFEAKDLSYVRRLRALGSLKIVLHNTNKNLKDLTRDDVNQVIITANKTLSPKTLSDFKRDLKTIWRTILPELDEKGRIDENVTPYVVRHLTCKIDKSKQERRKDRLTWEEFEKLLDYFSKKPCLQFYLMQTFESLARPQELLWRKIKDLELHDNYALINISDHGKEGIGLLKCIDAYAYLVSWLNVHPYKNNPESFLLLNEYGKQYKPVAINKHLRIACERLGINKPVTCYSLKRNGVTFMRLQGKTDVEIQHTARWTSTKQLKIYDMSEQRDTIKLELVKRGLIKPDEQTKEYEPKTKPCLFCKALNKVTDVACVKCNRPLDRERIAELEYNKEIKLLKEFMSQPQTQEMFRNYLKQQK